MKQTARALVLALGVYLLGCGREDSEALLPVAGRVTVNDKPLPTGSVSFRPNAAKGNKSMHHPTGAIDAGGNYELFTVGKRGAPPGWYKVLVFADANRLTGGPAHPVPPKWLVNVKYTTEKTTDLFVEIIDKSSPIAYDLKLTK